VHIGVAVHQTDSNTVTVSAVNHKHSHSLLKDPIVSPNSVQDAKCPEFFRVAKVGHLLPCV
jgi:hypothetical protein